LVGQIGDEGTGFGGTSVGLTGQFHPQVGVDVRARGVVAGGLTQGTTGRVAPLVVLGGSVALTAGVHQPAQVVPAGGGDDRLDVGDLVLCRAVVGGVGRDAVGTVGDVDTVEQLGDLFGGVPGRMSGVDVDPGPVGAGHQGLACVGQGVHDLGRGLAVAASHEGQGVGLDHDRCGTSVQAGRGVVDPLLVRGVIRGPAVAVVAAVTSGHVVHDLAGDAAIGLGRADHGIHLLLDGVGVVLGEPGGLGDARHTFLDEVGARVVGVLRDPVGRAGVGVDPVGGFLDRDLLTLGPLCGRDRFGGGCATGDEHTETQGSRGPENR